MGFTDLFEKLINEHRSATILGQQLALAKDQFSALEREKAKLEVEVKDCNALLQAERLDHKNCNDAKKVAEDRLAEELSEEFDRHLGLQLKRSRRTGWKWAAVCDNCGKNLFSHPSGNGDFNVLCSGNCGYVPPRLPKPLESELAAFRVA